MTITRVDQMDLDGRRVFCRVDFNVPLDDKQQVTDDTRIRAALPTIKHVLEAGGKLICGSHLGRPKGRFKPKLKMEPVGAVLAELLGKGRVLAADEQVGDGVRKLVLEMSPGDVVLLENLRFDPGEKANDLDFAKALATQADVYVNDAFGTAHRAHASTAGVAAYVEHKGAGFLMMKEIEALGRLLGEVERPFVALLGGAKVGDKIPVLKSLIARVDVLLIGGAMANTFLKAVGGEVGRSKVEEDSLETARAIIDQAAAAGVELLLPTDALVAGALDADSGEIAIARSIPQKMMALDIGPETRAAYAEKLAAAQTIFWNGPMGVFENDAFAQGTMEAAAAIAASSAFSVVGGGDSVSAVNQSGKAEAISHISTGGGASMEFMGGATLPGIAALEQRSAPVK